jgi:hypothetical protein
VLPWIHNRFFVQCELTLKNWCFVVSSWRQNLHQPILSTNPSLIELNIILGGWYDLDTYPPTIEFSDPSLIENDPHCMKCFFVSIRLAKKCKSHGFQYTWNTALEPSRNGLPNPCIGRSAINMLFSLKSSCTLKDKSIDLDCHVGDWID